MGEEKRINPRVSTTIEIIFKEPRSFCRAYMLNVSNGGLFIKTEEPLSLDSKVIIKLKLPEDKEEMEIMGRVVWTNPKGRKNSFPKGMGIQFFEISPEYTEKIEDFINIHLEEIKNNSII